MAPKRTPGLPPGRNIGIVDYSGFPGSANFPRDAVVGTEFDDDAPRRINDPNNTSPYITHYRPEAGARISAPRLGWDPKRNK